MDTPASAKVHRRKLVEIGTLTHTALELGQWTSLNELSPFSDGAVR